MFSLSLALAENHHTSRGALCYSTLQTQTGRSESPTKRRLKDCETSITCRICRFIYLLKQRCIIFIAILVDFTSNLSNNQIHRLSWSIVHEFTICLGDFSATGNSMSQNLHFHGDTGYRMPKSRGEFNKHKSSFPSQPHPPKKTTTFLFKSPTLEGYRQNFAIWVTMGVGKGT